ncbi:pentapeptide repeat-containing protein [Streptomyces cinnamoneus]|uniref:pentapeptide repeat-containing protein n=1 Tax=Streptomyces cinnamoneus TaxID=53446 RepID=UPI00342C21DE
MDRERRMRTGAHVLTAVSVGLLVVAVLSWDRLVRLVAHIPPAPFVLVAVSVGCAVAADRLYRRMRPKQQRRSAPRIRWWWVVLAFTAVLIAVWATTAALMPQTLHAPQGNERVKERIEVVRTGLAAGAGVGAAITVLLAFRRQHHHEEATERSDYDASERRITELYTKAVEQLGSPQAPVRLGGLYALERLGQAVISHRQTIVNVICAYLRMPYTPPADAALPPSEVQGRGFQQAVWRSRQTARALIRGKTDNQRCQELQVRLTAENILIDHLRIPPDRQESTAADKRFWNGIHIDLSHATLIDWDFLLCQVASANFSHATFTGPACFSHTSFEGPVWFYGATFTEYALFNNATFNELAWFYGATFKNSPSFGGARALLTTSKGERVDHHWPPGWETVPTAGNWGVLREHGE